MTAEELDHEIGHLATDEKWGWIAEPVEAELTRLREALFALAPHHQGASSPAGKIIAEALGIPFPLRAPYGQHA